MFVSLPFFLTADDPQGAAPCPTSTSPACPPLPAPPGRQGRGVDLNLKPLDLSKGEQNDPDFVAINPQHCVPTLAVRRSLCFSRLSLLSLCPSSFFSRAICTYLASQYGKSDSFYPRDPKTRARVDRLLYFDMGTLYDRFGKYAVIPVLFGGERPDPAKLEKLHEALGWLDDLLAAAAGRSATAFTVATASRGLRLQLRGRSTRLLRQDHDLAGEVQDLSAGVRGGQRSGPGDLRRVCQGELSK
ncbi:glutathione S-transferase [Penaeus vannamei]|uniref:Glutathione S-transferase n=1 Tax=Penaeus vannamei TaxID=6689 RepID=A0A423SDA5_PENVA|nr:glutathione S-transferase [Penaeus vannamei]